MAEVALLDRSRGGRIPTTSLRFLRVLVDQGDCLTTRLGMHFALGISLMRVDELARRLARCGRVSNECGAYRAYRITDDGRRYLAAWEERLEGGARG